MEIHTNKAFYDRRKDFRKSMTPHEVILWQYIRGKKLGYKFQRQHSIGSYITDFYCAQKKLIIELDGAQHLENKEYDRERTLYLENLGFKVLRFWNGDIDRNLNEVLMEIQNSLNQNSSPR